MGFLAMNTFWQVRKKKALYLGPLEADFAKI